MIPVPRKTGTSSLNFAQNVLLMDGGLGQELQKRKLPQCETLWSTASLIHNPEATLEIHGQFIQAGARLIIANTYMNSRIRLSRLGLESRFAELNLLACELAGQAAKNSGEEVFVAGSLPPLAGSYRPDLTGSFEENLRSYREMAGIMAPQVDLLVCETMTGSQEALAAATAAAETGLPVWVSWCLKDDCSDTSLSGENIPDLLCGLGEVPVDAFLFNCCSPESITSAIPVLRKHTDRPIGAYANAFAKIPEGWKLKQGLPDSREEINPAKYASIVSGWIEQGATLVGGCCEIGVQHIAELGRLLARPE